MLMNYAAFRVSRDYPRTLPVSFPTVLYKKPNKKDAWLP
jgi:L-aspartate oxidase